MSEKVFVLPQREEMLARLIEVDNNSHLQQKFYPRLTNNAGEERVAMGLVLMLQLAIHDYTKGMPMLAPLLSMRMDKFIDALCPDGEVASEAKTIFKELTVK